VVRQRNGEKDQQWKNTIREAERSGMSIIEFCRQRRLNEKQFYWWRRRLTGSLQAKGKIRNAAAQASFTLVSHEHAALDAGIELVLGDERRLRISKGVDEETLRAVLSAAGSAGC
jgi:hypothetical protein